MVFGRPSSNNWIVVRTDAERNPLVFGGVLALLAAVAFGLTIPFVQKFGRAAGAVPTATLLYAGAALGSIGNRREHEQREAPVRREHWRRLVLVSLVGAVFAPTCLAWGIQRTSSIGASLLLNFEAVFTVLLAWRVYHEPIGRRVALAVGIMAVGGACLLGVGASAQFGWGAVGVILGTFAWALDNTLTKPLADLNPTLVVRWKATLGAVFGLVLSALLEAPFPAVANAVGLLVCGATGYGFSLLLYLLAQRRIGAGRTGSIFALAPFVGAAASWVIGDRSAGPMTAVAASLFGIGVYLHLTETHHHAHTHEPIEHQHAHRHDDGHHDHVHDSPVEGEHSHPHRHDARTHDHDHAPDAHHGHGHPKSKTV